MGALIFRNMNRFVAIVYLWIQTALCLPGQPTIKTVPVKIEGLTSNSITCFYQDHTGFLWIGTRNGLNRFDGYEAHAHIYIPGDTATLSNSFINTIAEDAENRLWVGTRYGLNLYDRKKAAFQRYLPAHDSIGFPLSNHISDLYLDSKNRFWVLTKDELYLLSSSGDDIYFKNYLLIDPDHHVSGSLNLNHIVEDSNGNIYVTSWWNGMGSVDTLGRETKFYNDSVMISSISPSRSGEFWLGSFQSGILSFNPQTNQYINMLGLQKSRYILTLIEDRDGNLWFGNETLWRVVAQNDNSNQFVPIKTTVVNDPCQVIYEDPSGIVWLGFGSRGVRKYDPNADRFSKKHYLLPNVNEPTRDYITGVVKTDSILWLNSYDGGLIKYDLHDSRTERFTSANKGQLSSNIVLSSFLQDSILWVGTKNGLNMFDIRRGITLKKYYANVSDPYGMPHNSVRGIFPAKKGKLWIGTQEGLGLFDPTKGRFVHNSIIEQLKLTSYVQVFTDRQGNYWFYSENGMAKYDNETGTIKHFFTEPEDRYSISSNNINDINQDENGNIWIATHNSLSKYDRENDRFINFYGEQGYSMNLPLKIIMNGDRDIWFLTMEDLIRYNINNNSSKVYNENDGLLPMYYTFEKLENDYFFLGGEAGFYYFHPDSIGINENIPPVVLTGFTLSGEEIAPGSPPLSEGTLRHSEKIKLNHEQNTFGFKFSALNYTLTSKNSYSYMLEGYDTAWNFIGNKNRVYFMNMKPGKYTFKVKGSNNDGVWNPDPATVDIVISPPWWNKAWAYGIYMLILILLFFTYRRFILFTGNLKNKLYLEKITAQKMHEIDEMKLRFFMNISHEFKTPLALISSFMKKAMEEKSISNTLYKKVKATYQNSLQLNTLINQLLDLRKLETSGNKVILQNVDMNTFLHKLLIPFQVFTENREITLSTEINISEEKYWIDTEKTTKILTNLLSNAIKYSGTPANIRLYINEGKQEDFMNIAEGIKRVSKESKLQGEVLCLRISDNGEGIHPNDIELIFDRFYSSTSYEKKFTAGTGIGLSLVKQLVELLKGELYIESYIGEGSTFMVILPVDKSDYPNDAIIGNLKEKNNLYQEEESVHDILNQFIYDDKELVETTVSHIAGRKTILIIEDNIQLLNHLEEILYTAYNVYKATNGKKGLELMVDNEIDLVISDIMMPEMDGIEFCKLVKEDVRISHIPIILLTAKGTFKDEILGFETGADDYISKPFDPDVLLARIKSQFNVRKELWQRFTDDIKIIPENLSLTKRDEAFVKKVLDIIDENLTNLEFTPEHLYIKLNISNVQGLRKIKQLTNKTTISLINSIRLKKAAYILKSNEDVSITDLGYVVGFTSPSYFIHLFKEEFGLTPKQYNDSYHKGI